MKEIKTIFKSLIKTLSGTFNKTFDSLIKLTVINISTLGINKQNHYSANERKRERMREGELIFKNSIQNE